VVETPKLLSLGTPLATCTFFGISLQFIIGPLTKPYQKKPQDNFPVFFVHVPAQDTTAIPCSKKNWNLESTLHFVELG
jgi:hypothetical protein